MYYDLKFSYRISADAGMAHDGDGNDVEAYIQIKLGNCKTTITPETYDTMHEEQRETVASILKKDVEWITCISGEEYEANVDDEDKP